MAGDREATGHPVPGASSCAPVLHSPKGTGHPETESGVTPHFLGSGEKQAWTTKCTCETQVERAQAKSPSSPGKGQRTCPLVQP